MKKKNRVPPILGLLLLCILFTCSALLTMVSPIWANIPINIIIPIILIVFFKMVFFEKLKLSTLVCMRLLVVVTVFGLFSGETCVKIVLVLWIINILEATLTDISKKHWFNGITGFVLAGSLITFFTTENLMSWNGTYYSILTKGTVGTICWIIAYTIWNWIFISYDFSPSIAKLHVGILAAPIFGSLIMTNPGLWYILRGNSLTIGGITEIIYKEKLEKYLEDNKFAEFVQKSHSKNAQVILMIINVLLILATIFVL